MTAHNKVLLLFFACVIDTPKLRTATESSGEYQQDLHMQYEHIWRPSWQPMHGSSRVIAGVAVNMSKRPYQLSLQVDGVHDCGASIISKWWVITAAHCIQHQYFILPVTAITLRAGSENLQDSKGEIHEVKKIILHENFTRFPFRNDIALLKVKREFKFGGNIQRIQLPEPDDVFEEGSNVSVSGWGFTQAGNWSSLPDVLRVGYVPLVSQETCEKDHGSQGKIDDTMICAGYLATGGVDSCRGDSGGPLEMDGFLIGIVSWGRGCGLPNLPGVYTNVAKFREWIRNRTGV